MQAPPRTKAPEIREINGIKFNKMNENFYFCLQCNTPKKASDLNEHAFQHRKPQTALQEDQRSIPDSIKSSTNNIPPSIPRSFSAYHPIHVTSAPSLTPVPPERKNAPQDENSTTMNKLIKVLELNRNKKTQDSEPETLVIDSDESDDAFSYGVHNKHKQTTEAIAKEAVSKMKENEVAKSSESRRVDNSPTYPDGVSSLLNKLHQTHSASQSPSIPNPTVSISPIPHIPYKPQNIPKDFRNPVLDDEIRRKNFSESSSVHSKSSLSENLHNISTSLTQKSPIPTSLLQRSLPSSTPPKPALFSTPQQKSSTLSQSQSQSQSQKSPIQLSPIPTTPLGIPTKSAIESFNSFQSPQVSSFGMSPPKLSPLTSPIIQHNLPTILAKSPNVTSSLPVNKTNISNLSAVSTRITTPAMPQLPNSKLLVNSVETREHLLSQFRIESQQTLSIIKSLPMKRQRQPNTDIAEMFSKYRQVKGTLRKLAIMMKRGISIKLRQGFRSWYKSVEIY